MPADCTAGRAAREAEIRIPEPSVPDGIDRDPYDAQRRENAMNMHIPVRDIPAPPPSASLMKLAMRRHAGGVVVVTAGIGEERVGLTATSAVSLSVDPPTMLVCVNRASATWPVIARRRHFCVSILGAEHQAVAERFAGLSEARGAARYEGADWITMRSGASGLADAQAIVDCEVEEMIERHSHAILIGAVRDVRINFEEADSLVYRLGRFGSLSLP